MKIIKEDILKWWHKGYYILIPTNGWVNSQGEAASGRGLAMQVKKLFGNFSKILGKLLIDSGNQVYVIDKIRLITFPTKGYWKDPSRLNLIEESCKQLANILIDHLTIKLVMPKVGCGNGGLEWNQVEPILNEYFSEFGDRVIIVDNDQGALNYYMGDNPDNIKKTRRDIALYHDN